MAMKVKRVREGSFNSAVVDAEQQKENTLVDQQLGYERESGYLKIGDLVAVKKIKAGHADTAGSATTAESADYAGTASHANQAAYATTSGKAEQDSEGNSIKDTYATNAHVDSEFVANMHFTQSQLHAQNRGGDTLFSLDLDIDITGSASRLGSSNVGARNQPIYLMLGVPNKCTSKLVFDRVITTQAEFDELVAPTGQNSWNVLSNSISSVAFAGQFTYATFITIPTTVRKIQGFPNSVGMAKITCGGFGYVDLPTTNDYSISDLEVFSTGAPPGFNNCKNLVNCSAGGGLQASFFGCVNLFNCLGSYSSASPSSARFNGCKNLVNCKADSSFIAFSDCEYLVNCTGKVVMPSGDATVFMNCKDLTNCFAEADSLTNGVCIMFSSCSRLFGCSGKFGMQKLESTIFHSCKYLTNCTKKGKGGRAFRLCESLNGCGCKKDLATGEEDPAIDNVLWGSGEDRNTYIDIHTCTPDVDGGFGDYIWGEGGFDAVIRTQLQFDRLINSVGADANWLGFKSVAFVGQFTINRPTGIQIPSNVRKIQGLNSAKITVEGFVYKATAPNKALGVLWYDGPPSDSHISDLTISCTSTTSPIIGFYACLNLTNCAALVSSATFILPTAGFQSCEKLINCSATAQIMSTSGSTHASGFLFCTDLTDCHGETEYYKQSFGFYECRRLNACTSNSSARPVDGNGVGFNVCKQLTNCYGHGTHSGFESCSRLSNCITTEDPDTTMLRAFYNCTSLVNCEGAGKTAAFEACYYLNNCRGNGSTGFLSCDRKDSATCDPQ